MNSAYTSPPRGSIDIAGDLSLGAGSLISFLEGASLSGSWWYSSMDTGAWIILGLALLLIARSLLLINNRNGWGPIEVVMDSGSSDAKPTDDDLERIAKIRSYIVEQVPEPAAAAGSSALSQITTLATSSKLPVPPWVGALGSVAQWALLPPSGYRVVVDLRSTIVPQGGTSDPVVTRGSAPKATTAAGAESPLEADSTPKPQPGASSATPTPHTSGPAPSGCPSVVLRIGTRGRSKLLDVTTIEPRPIATTTAGGQEGVTTGPAIPILDPEEDVLRSAGYWISGWILSHCKLVPDWTTWPAVAGKSVGRYVKRRTDADRELGALGTDNPKRITLIDGTIRELETARAWAPTSGMILTALAEQYELRDDFVTALEINLQVVRLYPRYYVARYRAAVGLSLLATDQRWFTAVDSPDQQALRILELLTQIGTGGSTPRTIQMHLVKSAEAEARPSRGKQALDTATQSKLALLSAVQLRQGIKLSNFAMMGVLAFRREERRFWLARMRRPFLIRHNLGSAMPAIAKLAGFLEQDGTKTLVPGEEIQKEKLQKFFTRPNLPSVIHWTGSRNESAQVLYNLACYMAKEPGPDPQSAIDLLERAQLQPYANQIKASWTKRDPDLNSLWSNDESNMHVRERFKRLVDLLWGGELARAARKSPDPPPRQGGAASGNDQ